MTGSAQIYTVWMKGQETREDVCEKRRKIIFCTIYACSFFWEQI